MADFSVFGRVVLFVFGFLPKESFQNNPRTVSFNITPVFHQSVFNLKLVDRQSIRCNVVDSVLYWLSEVLRVDNEAHHSLPLERKCPHGYYSNETSAHGERFCVDSCSNETKCGPVPIPENHLKPCRACDEYGRCWSENQTVDSLDEFQSTHYVLYVSAIADTLDCKVLGGVVSAGTCHQDRETDRPVVGYLNFCPGHLGGRHSFPRMMSHMLQELIGALGFSESLLPFFRDRTGKPLMPRGRDGLPRRNRDGQYLIDYLIAKTYVYPNWTNARPVKEHAVKIVTLPNVVMEARAHFDCPNMTGMPLEDQYSSKLLWESRLLWGDIMTSHWDKDPSVSRITLALLEDTGWYYPRYKYGFNLFWGRGKGCAFVNQSCLGWVRHGDSIGMRPSPFCVPGKRRPLKGCSVDHTHLTSCVFSTYNQSIPRRHTYWKSSSKFGGNVPSSDYCPFFNLFTDNGLECSKLYKYPKPLFPKGSVDSLMYLHAGSKCIETSKPWRVFNETSKERSVEKVWGAGCYKVVCTDERFYVVILNVTVAVCNETGQLIRVRIYNKDTSMRYTGEIICPSYDYLCGQHVCKSRCMNGGQCYAKNPKRCFCKAGFQGSTCHWRNDFHHREDKPTCHVLDWDPKKTEDDG